MKNKKLADRVLVILLLAFIIVVFIRIRSGKSFYIDLLSFVIEAALIGGIADWFAVTALYRKPLGFSWHTAIIPRNRIKVIEAISNVVQHELLSQQTLRDKVNSICFIDIIIKFIDSNLENDGYLTELGKKYSIKLLNNLEVSKLTHLLEKAIKGGLAKLPLSDLLNKAALNVMESKSYEKPLGELIDHLIAAIGKDSTRQEIFNIINELINQNLDNKRGVKKALMKLVLGVAEGTDSINIMDAAASIQKELIDALKGLKDVNNPNHIKMLKNVREVIEKLDSDEALIGALEAWKLETIENISVETELNIIAKNLRAALIVTIESKEAETRLPAVPENDTEGSFELYLKNVSSLVNWARQQVQSYWQSFKSSENSKHVIEAYLKEFLFKSMDANHWIIGILVKKCLSNLTDEALNDFIEKKAGNDLHWIRINGCLIGAIFGLVVFLFLHLVYMPLLTKYGIGI